MSGLLGASSLARRFSMSEVWWTAGWRVKNLIGVLWMWSANLGPCGNDLSSDPYSTAGVVSGDLVRYQPEEWSERGLTAARSRLGAARDCLDVSCTNCGGAMVRPDKDKLSGWVEVDETWVGGWGGFSVWLVARRAIRP